MKSFRSRLPHATGSLLLSVLVILLAISGGCTQQSPGTAETQSGIKVTQPDDSHIIVAFIGAPGMEELREMEVAVTDSKGKNLTLSKGSRLSETPLPLKSTISFSGPYSGKDHVVVTGYFPNQSGMALVDMSI
jgi:hypothetical protein